MTLRAKGSFDLGIKVWKFPCGEVGVKAAAVRDRVLTGEHVRVELDWEGNDDIMALAQLVDIVKNAGAKSWSLKIPYFPYSRQDRRCSPGEAHALKVFCMFLNSLGFSEVRTLDAHSYVLEALVDNLSALPQEECACFLPVHEVLVAPDAGAEKKIYKHAQVTCLNEEDSPKVLCASKFRAQDGSITGVYLQADESDIKDKLVCVVDDLCDGGATFLSVGGAVRALGPATLNLYVTHGMFTKGYDALFSVFDNIYVRNHWGLAPPVPVQYNGRFHLI
jgi:ribose-phosphate pyrophosphokinase